MSTLTPAAADWLGVDPDSRSFWEGLCRHELRLEACDTCARVRFPPMPACPYCGTVGGREREGSGRGRVYSWIRVHRALLPEMADQLPYTIVTVTLDEGCRMVGRLDPHVDPFDGMAVAVHYVDHDGWTELRFHAANPWAAGAGEPR